MTRIETLFFDVGGACLSKGWDRDARLAATSHFCLDVEETEGRHHCSENPSSHSCDPDHEETT